MLTAYWDSLHECFSRRVAIVLLGLAALAALAFCILVRVRVLPNGASSISLGTLPAAPNAFAVPSILVAIVGATGGLWLMLAIFAVAPVLTATLEKGWLELIFSKGTPRWRIFLGRFLGGATLYALAVSLATLPLALRLWWTTGISTWTVAVALLIETLSFIALLSAASLATLLQKGVALPTMASVAILFFSPLLAHRREWYYPFVSSNLGRGIVDWVYRLLPKCSELENLGGSFIQGRVISSWWPVWTTCAFTLVILGLTLWLLERKSF
jgi:ABC-type transport system involved in multi-copper enzyme maturation permease subunit